MGLKIENSLHNFYVSPEENSVSTGDNKGSVKTQNVIVASNKSKLPPISGSVDFTALGCDTENKLAQASYMAAASKAGIVSESAQREFAAQMIARYSSELAILGKKEISLDDAKVKESLNNRSVSFRLSPEIKTQLEQFRENYVAAGGKIRYNQTPTINLREPSVVGGANDSPKTTNSKFHVLLNNAGNPTDAKRILAQFAEDRYRGGNLWGQNYRQIGEMSATQGVKPKITNVKQVGNKVSVEFELTTLDCAKIHENYKTVQTEVNRAVAAYEDFANNNEVSSFLRGVFNGALKSVEGTIGLLNLPETMKALWQVVAHPVETFNALSKELSDTWEEFKTAPANKKSEIVGELVGQAIIEILIGKGLGKAGSILAKTKHGAKILEQAKLLKSATVAKIAETFSDEAASAATSRLRGKLQTTLYAGIPADALVDLAVVSANKIKTGAVKFSEFSRQMVEQLGESVRPKLLELYQDAFEKVYGTRKALELDELLGGHSIEKHVGKSDSWLRQRLLNEPDTEIASSFRNYETANRTVSKAIKENSANIEEWLAGDKAKLIMQTEMNENVGIVLERGKGGSVGLKTATETNKAEIIITRDNTPQGWHVLTSYPSR